MNDEFDHFKNNLKSRFENTVADLMEDRFKKYENIVK